MPAFAKANKYPTRELAYIPLWQVTILSKHNLLKVAQQKNRASITTPCKSLKIYSTFSR